MTLAGEARDHVLALLDARDAGVTICPSEAARTLSAPRADSGPQDWRDAMPRVHAAVDRLVADGVVRLSWKGKPIGERTGPYRIGRA